MGISESKLPFLTYEDAAKRITGEEVQRLRETFKRHSGSTNVLSKQTFYTHLLSEIVPSKLAEKLYFTCGGGSKGIGFREAVVLLVIIANGTLEEKVRFLFHLVSSDGNIIVQKDLKELYFLCDHANSSLPSSSRSAFLKKEKLNFEDFFEWIISNNDFNSVTTWLLKEQLSDHAIAISNSVNSESFYSSLSHLTKLTEQDIVELEKRYWALKSPSPSGKFDLDVFKSYVSPLLPEQFVAAVFLLFDKNNDGHIDFKEFVCGISLFCRGSNTERLRACFEIFDLDNDNYLSKEEIKLMAQGLVEIVTQYDSNTVDNLQEQIMESIILTEYERLALNDFQHWGYSSPFVYEFLLLLSQICHIVFGLCPLFKKEEGNIIRRWMERENIKGLQFGSLYYIISITWWDAWKKYVSFDTNESVVEQSKRDSDISDTWFDDIVNTSCNEGEIVSSVESSSKHRFTVSNETSLKNHNIIHMSCRNSSQESPGQIINSHLLEPVDSRKLMVLTGEGGKLKQGADFVYEKSYEILSEPVWKALSLWYEADIALPRTVIVESSASITESPEIELYPIQIDLYRHTQPPRGVGFNMGALGINNIMSQIYGNIVNYPHTYANTMEQPSVATPKRILQYRACFSRKNTIRQIVEFLSQRLKLDIDDLRLWSMDDEKEMVLLEEDHKALGDVCNDNEGKLLLEVRNRDLSWPEEMSSLVTTRNFRERSNTGPLEKGATGLHNLGNTCFMNSAIQCLSNTRPLTKYFSKKIHEFELNKSNPLGMKGVLAKRYGDMILDLWSGIYRSIAPVKLRCTLGRYAPRFNGFQQHDSQEFLSFLLDGLHEDLNRVHDKPYVELKDSDGRPDSIVAQEAWDNHIKRNQSIIVDLFQGQLKSQVRCLHCSHCSVTFDPFTFLSLPLPMESSIHLEIPFFWCAGSQPSKYGILLPQGSTIKILKTKVSELTEVPLDRFILAEVVGPSIVKFLDEKLKVEQNLASYIFAYEFEHSVCEGVLQEFSSQFDKNKSSTRSKESLNKNNDIDIKEPKQNISTESLDEQSNRSPVKRKGDVDMDKKVKISSKLLKSNTFQTTNFSSNDLLEESDLFEIYESPFREESDCNGSISLSKSLNRVLGTNQGFIVALHRKMVQSNHYFLSWQKFRPTLFGNPILLSYHGKMTNRDIYCKLWKHASKYVTGVSIKDDEQSYPFSLKKIDPEGNYCSSCPWYKFCRGCLIACDDSNFDVKCSHIAIDWDTMTLHLHYQQAQERNFLDHQSVQHSQKQMHEPISIDQCLKDFTKEEELGEEETWYCSKCKVHQTIAKKLEIWKLPPVFVIHLKRFLNVNNRWIKSNKLVRFPVVSFDPSMYVAKDDANRTYDSCFSSVSSSNDLNSNLNSIDQSFLSAETSCGPIHHFCDKSGSESGLSSLYESTSCIETIKDTSNNDKMYSLFAISCHSGMLNGGHYITYAKNPNGKWYCYNDSSCKEVSIDLIEKESPYMLFFEKLSLDSASYMPDVSNKEAVNIQMEEEEFEKEVKKYCSIM